MESVDYLIVGSGLTGGVIARLLSDAGREVLVIESRNHLGGNVYDYDHHSGIKVHKYGPHFFRCNSKEIWEFVNRFSKFYKYEACIKTLVDGKIEDWPINQSYLNRLNPDQNSSTFKGTPHNFEEACLSKMPLTVYDKFVKGYTLKQWGVNPTFLDSELASRISVRKDHESRLTPEHKFQALPYGGYKNFIENLFEGIPRILNYKFTLDSDELRYSKKLIYSGPIDEYFQFKIGHLQYRGQLRETLYFPDIEYYQPYAQINNPNLENGAYIRTIEWKHIALPESNLSVNGTVITREYPFSPSLPDHFEYPFPDFENLLKYKQYRKLANELNNVIICGRLGEYRYYDMDQAIGRAMGITKKIFTSMS
jgi:UDP-galactopyranose mutase